MGIEEPTQEQIDEERRRIQINLNQSMVGEMAAMTQRYRVVYGLSPATAVWGTYSAMLTALGTVPAQFQLDLMQEVKGAMEMRIKALSGEPPKPAQPEPEPAESAA